MLTALLALAVLLSLASLFGDSRKARYIHLRLSSRPPRSACPPATVIVPVKGRDAELRENLAALAALDYPDFELIVAARTEADIPAGCLPASARVVLAGAGPAGTGEKVHNLLQATEQARPTSEVFAFADSDGRPDPDWLRALVRELKDGAGLATGYRWHAPPAPAGFWSLMRSSWNAVIAGGFPGPDLPFAWGGAMAIRRDVFERARVADYWRGVVSDDYRISEAVRAAGLRIAFAPQAMVSSRDRTTAGEFLRWIERQMVITRAYNPRLWRMALAAHILYCAAMAAAILWPSPIHLAALGVIVLVSCRKAAVRVAWFQRCLPTEHRWFRRYGWTHTALAPLTTWIWLYSLLASARSRVIEWRGYRYRIWRDRTEELPPSGATLKA